MFFCLILHTCIRNEKALSCVERSLALALLVAAVASQDLRVIAIVVLRIAAGSVYSPGGPHSLVSMSEQDCEDEQVNVALAELRADKEIQEFNETLADLRSKGYAQYCQGSRRDAPCAGCGEPPVDGAGHQACAGCGAAVYCSKACQRRDWKQHKGICKEIQAMKSLKSPATPAAGAGESNYEYAGDHRALIGFSSPAQNALLAQNKSVLKQIYWQQLEPSCTSATELRRTTLEKIGARLQLAGMKRMDLALRLANGLQIILSAVYAYCEADSRKRLSSKQSKAKQQRHGVVVVECNDVFIEDLICESGVLPSTTLGILYLSTRAAVDYFVKRQLATQVAAEDMDAVQSMPANYYQKGAEEMILKLLEMPPATVPVLISYRHKEDATGFAISSFGLPASGGILETFEGVFKGILADARMTRAQAVHIKLPACTFTLFDTDERSFTTLMAQPDSSTSVTPVEDEHKEATCSSQRYQCAMCKHEKPKGSFSKAQLKKSNDTRRCKMCVDPETSQEALVDRNSRVVDAMFDSIQAAAEHGEDQWAAQLKGMGLAASPQEAAKTGSPIDQDKVQRFLLHYMTFIAPLAALNFHRAGKGALFIFSKIAMEDLFDLNATGVDDTVLNPGPRGAFKLDRQFVVVWGSQKPHGRCAFTAVGLSMYFKGRVNTLQACMEQCSREQFPLVFCCDPTGDCLPDELKELRDAASPPADASYRRRSEFVAVSMVRFFDFNVMLEEGRGMARDTGQSDMMGCNMDRHYTDPNTD